MYCPVCNQEQVSDETRFCSRCGFLLTGISQVISNGGVLPQDRGVTSPDAISPRKKGIRQGTLLLFLSFIIVPLLALITSAVRAEPFVVAAAAILLGGGGLMRIIYALLFESGQPILSDEGILQETIQKVMSVKRSKKVLPPQHSVPVSSYMPPSNSNWRDTNDLIASPPSVTDPTTKLLDKEK